MGTDVKLSAADGHVLDACLANPPQGARGERHHAESARLARERTLAFVRGHVG